MSRWGFLKQNLQNVSELKILCAWHRLLRRTCHSKITRQIHVSFVDGFVKMYVSWSSYLQNYKQISLLFTKSLMKWNLMSMCLVLLWNKWFFDNAMAELLSKNMVVSSWWFCDNSFNTLLIQTAWHTSLVATTYSSSIEDKVTMGCFFEAHETTHVPKWNVYPDVLFLSSMFPPLSLSV